MVVEAVVAAVTIIVVAVVVPLAIHLVIVELPHTHQYVRVVVIQDLVLVHNVEDNQMVKHETILY